jgi:hypothetical protein
MDAVPPRTSIESARFWTVQRGSDSGVVTAASVVFPADRSVAFSRLGDDADGSVERMASTVPATRTAITPLAITQVSRARVILGVRAPDFGKSSRPQGSLSLERLCLHRISNPLARCDAASHVGLRDPEYGCGTDLGPQSPSVRVFTTVPYGEEETDPTGHPPPPPRCVVRTVPL